MKTIAIVGRPNVGKSTLFNRLAGRRVAIVEQEPGVTRDYLEAVVEWQGVPVRIVDTGGIVPDAEEEIAQAVQQQVAHILHEADGIFFVVDARSEITAADFHLAALLRKQQKPVILVANKCDDPNHDLLAYTFAELGVTDTIIPCSALHGRNIPRLLEAVAERLAITRPTSAAAEEEKRPSVAIIGRPNVGKSSLLNAITGKQRSIVTPVAGTTRDAVDTTIRFYGQELVLVDTAGLRRKSRIQDSVEFYSMVRTQAAVRRADVVIVVVDATAGFYKQEKQMIDMAFREGKGVVVAVNKWDAVPKGSNTAAHWRQTMEQQLPLVEYLPVVFVSAVTKRRVPTLLKTALQVYQKRQMRIPTARLNETLQVILQKVKPPSSNGKEVKLNYITQVATAPPHFVLFSNFPKKIPAFYKRYLERAFREEFDFIGVPLQLSFRSKH